MLSGKANMIASDASQLRCIMVEGMIEKTKKRLGGRFLIGFVAERATLYGRYKVVQGDTAFHSKTTGYAER